MFSNILTENHLIMLHCGPNINYRHNLILPICTRRLNRVNILQNRTLCQMVYDKEHKHGDTLINISVLGC